MEELDEFSQFKSLWNDYCDYSQLKDFSVTNFLKASSTPANALLCAFRNPTLHCCYSSWLLINYPNVGIHSVSSKFAIVQTDCLSTRHVKHIVLIKRVQ